MIRAAPGLYPVREIVPPDTGAAFLVLAGPYGFTEDELVDGEALFVDRVDRVMRPNGYRLAGTFEPGSEIAAGVVGFRLIRSNAFGDHLWVDDFITGGIGANVERSQLLSFLIGEAKKLGLTQIHLDIVPDTPPANAAEETATGLAAVRTLNDRPHLRSSSPIIDRANAELHGFREWAGRFVLRIESDDDSRSSLPAEDSPLSRRRPLGRLRRPRRPL